MSLDIAPLSAKVKFTFNTSMSCAKKMLFVLSALFGLEFLSLGLFANGIFSWNARHVPPLLKATARTHDSVVKSNFAAKTDSRLVFERYAEPTPASGGFVTAKQGAEAYLRSVIIVPLFVGIIAPKVSRYIFNSVLNI